MIIVVVYTTPTYATSQLLNYDYSNCVVSLLFSLDGRMAAE